LISCHGEAPEQDRRCRKAEAVVDEVELRAVVKKSDGWWIGWVVDLPGVNAQERTREELLESLKIGAGDMLVTPLQLDEEEAFSDQL